MTDLQVTREVIETVIQSTSVELEMSRLVLEFVIAQLPNPPLPPSTAGGWGMIPIA